jgi:hypothetical protein
MLGVRARRLTINLKGAIMTILPFTVVSKPPLTRKQLTSSGMFYTPGLFRALQNDYRIKGKTRQRAIKILSDGYGLPPEEARGL